MYNSIIDLIQTVLLFVLIIFAVINRRDTPEESKANEVDRARLIAKTFNRRNLKNYRCGVCQTNDPLAYQRCNDPRCPDGRDA